ncbi:MAG: 16S rRNA (guanine(527)-N(7))-methyltransferase RsmG [bacterium]
MTKLTELLTSGCDEIKLKLNTQQEKQFLSYLAFLQEKSKVVNLTAIHEAEDIIIKHFLDSLTVARFIEGESSLLDVGTGAGFPGVPLKIYYPALKLTLLDSLQKRIAFLQELADILALKDIEFLHGRAEEYGSKDGYREKFAYVVSRAVADLRVLAEYCLPFVEVGGAFLALKGPSSQEELKTAQGALKLLGGEFEKIESFNLPLREDQRNLIIIRKAFSTPQKYPRRAGMPQKKPLC